MSGKAPKIPRLARYGTEPPTRLALNDPAKQEQWVEEQIGRYGPNIIARAKTQMENVLTEAGLPTRTERGGFRGLKEMAELRGHPVAEPVWYAALILDKIEELRCAQAEGIEDKIIHAALHLGALMKEANVVLSWSATVEKGLSFEEGPKKKGRRDLLARLIDDALMRLGKKASARAILEDIKGRDGIQEIEEDRTIWRVGAEKKTEFKTFENRVSDRRKKFSPKK